MIEAEGLTKRFSGVTAVEDVTFSVPAGSIAGFLGPNGSGKTTTIRMITGFLPPTRGSVRVAGLDIRRQWREARRRIGYLPESAPVYPEMRVEEFLLFRARLHGVPRPRRRPAIDRAMQRCSLGEVRRRLIGHLSKGFRQRTGLAAALLHDPDLLVLDEPTVGLDPAQVLEFRRLLRALAGECTVLVSSHILSEIEAVCDRVVMLRGGRLIASGDLADFRALGAGASRYVLEAREPGNTFAAVPNATQVEAHALEGRWRRIVVVAAANAPDLRESLAEQAASRGVLLRELRREPETLEELFVRLADPKRSSGRDTADTPPPDGRAA